MTNGYPFYAWGYKKQVRELRGSKIRFLFNHFFGSRRGKKFGALAKETLCQFGRGFLGIFLLLIYPLYALIGIFVNYAKFLKELDEKSNVVS